MNTWGRSRRQQRGFVLVVVIIIVALLALMGASIMNVLSEDMQIIGQSRRGFEARAVAEGGVSEMMNDTTVSTNYPDLATAGLRTTYNPNSLVTTSMFNVPAEGRQYQGEIRLLRFGPAVESDIEQARTVTYEFFAVGDFNQMAQTEFVAEVFNVIGYPRGWSPAERHYR